MTFFFNNVSLHNQLSKNNFDSELGDDEFILQIDNDNFEIEKVFKMFKNEDCVNSLYNGIEQMYGELGESPDFTRQEELIKMITTL
jgi:hypothetical protein|tara:strand:+ start:453 stop:710 length:258 start_codon:yes stop_codon:yes gene_type:complete